MPIKILPLDIVNKIAAGEVVERPASVVKELVENSLDAGASAIEVEIGRGGLQLIRVSDDGSGMDPAEMRLSLERHATSKITGYDDLLTIASYGFRGEALPSIASVSRLTMSSRPEVASSAWVIECDGGGIVSQKASAGNRGTTITVEDLFAKVPARRKFLKADMTEVRRVADEVVSQALANPKVSFRLVIDGKESFDYPGGSLEQRLEGVLTAEVFRSMLPVDFGQRPLAVKGFALRPDKLLARRRDQYLFVNGRRVSDRLAGSAIYRGYGPSLLGRHPSYVIFLEISPKQVDINVHPAKREVRFRDEGLVFNTVRSAIHRAMFQEQGAPDNLSPGSLGGFFGTDDRQHHGPEGLAQEDKKAVYQLYGSEEPKALGDLFGVAEPRSENVSLVSYWQAHNRYIFAGIKNGIIMVDQHAAHERVLFEELLKSREKRLSQQLLFPISLELNPSQKIAFEQFQDIFTSFGFDIKQFSGNTVVIEGLPAAAGDRVEGEKLIRNILSDLCQNPAASLEPAEKLAMSFACHAAVKAGQPLSQEEMNRLIDRLFATSSPYLDPHGRPAVIRLTLDDLERRFGRI
ncbi:MAG: DNA mismatch repair endonuclease MutL [Candidatus Edwardsbacteria bacterium]|nr:DNA mismatch repair endonuclease MutL [Candidatus Edwardsbacteria bacterium]